MTYTVLNPTRYGSCPSSCGGAENVRLENAELENPAPTHRGGKHGTGKRGTSKLWKAVAVENVQHS